VETAYDRLPLNALRVFEAVATRLNFAEAAEALHVTPAAVSQQVKTLEDYLQTPLFRRSGRRVELTVEGADLLPRVRRGLDELEAAMQAAKQQRESGVLNVSMLSSFLQKWFTPRIGELRAAIPDIDLHIHTSREAVDFSRSDFHAAIRMGKGPYPGMHAELLLVEWLVAVASPALFAKHGVISCEDDLSRHPVLHGVDETWAEFLAQDVAPGPAPLRGMIDDSVSVVSAATEGLGYAITRWSLVARDVAAGRLALAAPIARKFRFAYYFVCPESYILLPKVAKFRDWIRSEALRHPLPPHAA